MEKNKFIKQNYQIFLNSFKRINLKIFLILAFDVLFYLIFIQTGKIFIKILNKKAEYLNLTEGLANLNQQAAATMLSSIKSILFFMIFFLILFIILMIINYSFFKGLIWSITANKKFNLEFFKKFLKLNFIWLPIWIFLIFLFTIIIKSQVILIYMGLTLAIAFYFTNILYPLFLKDNKLRKIKEAFKLGIKKIHHFIIPYVIIIALFIIILRIYNLFALNLNINPNVFLGIGIIFIAWLRYYFVEIVEHLHK